MRAYVASSMIPPMWVIGNGTVIMSVGSSPAYATCAFDAAITDASVCFAPLGVAVVPDEK